jgi:hypothetical protein
MLLAFAQRMQVTQPEVNVLSSPITRLMLTPRFRRRICRMRYLARSMLLGAIFIAPSPWSR